MEVDLSLLGSVICTKNDVAKVVEVKVGKENCCIHIDRGIAR